MPALHYQVYHGYRMIILSVIVWLLSLNDVNAKCIGILAQSDLMPSDFVCINLERQPSRNTPPQCRLYLTSDNICLDRRRCYGWANFGVDLYYGFMNFQSYYLTVDSYRPKSTYHSCTQSLADYYNEACAQRCHTNDKINVHHLNACLQGVSYPSSYNDMKVAGEKICYDSSKKENTSG